MIRITWDDTTDEVSNAIATNFMENHQQVELDLKNFMLNVSYTFSGIEFCVDDGKSKMYFKDGELNADH